MERTKTLSTLTDESLMPFGKFKDKKMTNVPYWHFLWLYNQKEDGDSYSAYVRRKHPEVFDYIHENLEVLIEEKNKNLSRIHNNTVIF